VDGRSIVPCDETLWENETVDSKRNPENLKKRLVYTSGQLFWGVFLQLPQNGNNNLAKWQAQYMV
jgi:hypothetical protein